VAKTTSLIPVERIERSILLIRGHKVMLDSDLAALDEVETKYLTRAVKRNIDRFPADFMFQLTKDEFHDLRRHFGTSSDWGGRRYPPYAFTEQGVAMLSSVLRSPRAIQVNIEIMRAFDRLRQMIASHADLARKLEALEKSTMPSSRWSSTPSADSWPRRRGRNGRSAFTRNRRRTDRGSAVSAATADWNRAIQHQIEATERQIDRLVYELDELMEEEIAIVGEARRGDGC
jgi:hypothetical protein